MPKAKPATPAAKPVPVAPAAKPKAYSYLRFSTPEQMAGDSFRRQTSMAREYADRNGLELDDKLTFRDLGVSAFRGKNAEAGRLADFLAAVEAGVVAQGSFLLVESLDRISRQSARKALRVLEEICDAGVTVVTLTDSRVYTVESLDGDPTALLMSLLIFIRANEESATKARRLKSAWSSKRSRAGSEPMTSRCPGWLRLKRVSLKDRGEWEVIPERAAVVQRVFREALEGRGQHAITAGLNREGVPVFGSGEYWHRPFIARLLTSPAVVGTFVPHSTEHEGGKRVRKPLEPVHGYFPAVVDLETFQRVQALRMDTASPQRGRHAATEIQNVLGGLLQCARCGGSMVLVSKGRSGKRLSYVVCSKARIGAGCSYSAVRYDRLENALRSNAYGLLDEIPGGGEDGASVQAELEQTDNNLMGMEDALSHLAETYRTTRSPTILAQIQEVEAEQAELKEKRRQLAERRDATVGPFMEQRTGEALKALTGKTLDRKRANVALRTILSAAVVDPDQGTLTIRWKHGAEADCMFTFPRDN